MARAEARALSTQRSNLMSCRLKPVPFTFKKKRTRKRPMPRRNDIQKILVIGSGPIVIGQSAEFDYSGTQACKALKQEGYEVVLVNSNPATIMTDPELADRTYIEPLTREYVEEIIRIESEMLAGATRLRQVCPAAHRRRADGAQSGRRSGRRRHPRPL